MEGYESVPEEAYIGVFFENGVNSYGCGGFSQWSNNNFVIAAFGDDPTTPNLQDGFTAGESYTWFLRINNSEDPLDGWTDYIGTNVEMESNEYFTPTWLTNGLSNLLSADFILYAEWSNCMDISACNYNQATNISDVESCEYCFEDNCEIYPSDIFDCDGNCWDTDNDGICNITELEGCTDPSADFLYDPLATEDDGSCMYQGCLDSQAQNYALDPDSDLFLRTFYGL